MRIDAVITGTGGALTKISNDTLILGGANNYTGLTTLSAGVIEAKNSAAFGTNAGATTMTTGTTIQIEGSGLVIPEPITINGTGVVVATKNQGAIKNTRNINKWTGRITLGSASTIVSGTLSGTTADSLIMETGGIDLSSNTLTTDVVKGMRIDGVISGTGGLTKISNDTLILGGANSYSGATTLTNGIIQLQNQDGLGSTNPGLNSTTASNTSVASGTAIKIVGSNFVTPETLVLSGTGIANRGAVYNQANKNTLSGAISFEADASFYSDGTSTSDSLILSGTISTGISATGLSSGLVLNLDAGNSLSYNGSGSTWYDISGSGNHVTMQNSSSITYSNSGGGYFDLGTNGYFNNLTTTNLPIANNNYTMSVWVQFPSSWSANGMISIGNDWGTNNSVNAFRTNSNNQIYNYWWGNDLLGTGTLSSPTNTWFNAVAQYNGTTRKVWINGVQLTSDNAINHNVTNAVLNIGATNNSEYLKGKIGQALIYNRALSSEEIIQNFNSQAARFNQSTISGGGSSSSSIVGVSTTAANITINSVKGIRISGVISGIGQLTKLGADSLLLTGTYSSTGAVNINAGSVKLGAANIINDSTDINFNGGILSTNHDEILRKLYLSNSSTIKLGTNAHQISFVSIDTLLNRKQLTIYGWLENYNDTSNADTKLGGTLGKIKFLNDTLLGYQLDQFKFNNPSNAQNYYAVQYKATKFLVPIANPISSGGGGGGGGGAQNNDPTGFSNIFISTSARTGGDWTGTGSIIDPKLFTPSSDNANIEVNELVGFLNLGYNVKISTVNANGRQTGTVIANAPFAASNISTAINNLDIEANDNVVLYQNITLNNNASTNPVTKVDFKSASNDVVLQAGLILNAKEQNTSNNAVDGGEVNLTATTGKVRVYQNGYIESKGANNISASASANGGNGGRVTLIGTNGVSIFGNINTTNGTRGSAKTDYTNSRPGTLTISNNASGIFDGQSVGNIAVGNIIKQGTGLFSLTKSYWAGHNSSSDIFYKANDTVSAGTLYLNSSAALSDSANVYISEGAILNLNGKTETIGTIAGAGTISSTTGLLTLSGVTTSSSKPILTNFSGGLSGGFGLIKNGVDSLQISGDNNSTNVYTGVFTITNGVVKVSNQNALGTTAGITIVNNTGTILIDSNNYTIDEPFTISGSGVTSGTAQGAIRNLGKITNLTGVITLGGAATIASAGYNIPGNGVGYLDSLIIKTGGINAGAYSLTTDVIKGMRIDGVISGTGGSLTKISGDTLVLGGTNTYTGLTLINAGAVEMKNSAAFGTASGTTTVASGATVQIEGTDFAIAEPITISGVGVVVNSVNQGAIKNIRKKNTWSGLITLGANATIVSGNLSGIAAEDSLVVSTGGINLQGNTLTADVVKGMNISGVIFGTGGLTKTSGDTLILGGANYYTGATNINGGVIQLQNQDGLGSNAPGGSSTAASTTTIANAAALKINGTGYVIPEPILLTGTGINATGAIRNPSGSNTLSSLITVSADARINIDAGTITLTNSTESLKLTGALNFGGASGNLTINGPMTGAGSFIKDGGVNTILTLRGNNTGYTGNISIGTLTTTAAGVLKINTNSNALGATSGRTTINNGSALELEGGLSFAAEPLTIAGTGLSTEGVIRNVSGNNSYTGPITLSDASRINVDAGTLTLTSTATINTTASAYTLTIGGASNMTSSGIISGTGSLIKDGASTLFLDAENTYTGSTNISNGIVQVQKSNALGSLNAGTGSSNTTVSDGAVIQIYGTNINIPEAIKVYGTGISNRGVIRNFTGSSGVNALTSTITLNSNARINVDAGTLSLTGTSNGTSLVYGTYALNAGVNTSTSMIVSGLMSGTGNLTKDSLGTLILSGSNTDFAGAIRVHNGVMNIQNSNALGTTDVETTVLTNGAIQLQGGITVAEANINLAGTGINNDGALRNISGNNIFSGTLNLTGNTRVYIDAGTLSMTSTGTSINMGTNTLNIGGPSTGSISVSGVVASAASGAGTLTKDGASTSNLNLSGDNTYTGNTVVSSGVLNISHANALGTTSGSTSILSGAALEIQGGITMAAEPISVSSTGISSTTGGIRSIFGNNIIPGVVNVAAASRINVDQDVITLNNATSALVLNSTNTIGGAGDINIPGKITGVTYTNTLSKDGSGTLTLNNSSNDYAGQTIITAGIVKINNPNALGSSASATQNNTFISGTGTVYIDGNAQNIAEAFTISGTGSSVEGVSQGAIRNASGINTLSGPITLSGNATMVATGTSTTDSLLITGNIATGTATSSSNILTIDVTKGVRLTGIISGTGGFTKSSGDTLLLYNAGANTYSGITTINGGVVRINSSTAFGNASSTSTAHTNITAGTLLIDINGFTIAEPFTIAGDGISVASVAQGAIKTLYGNNTLNGQITLGSDARINAGVGGTISDSLVMNSVVTSSSPYALTLSTNVGTRMKGVISGAGSLIKEGQDTLLLKAVNTYTGLTKITSGCLLAGIDNALSAGSEFIFNGGTYSSGGFTNTLGKLSVLDHSKINIKFLPIHGITFTGKGSFAAGKNVIIYGWSGLTAPGISKTGALISSNPTQTMIYLRPTGLLEKSKSGGLTKYGQIVSASIGADFNGRIFFTNATSLSQFQLNRLRFYVDPSIDYTSPYNYFSSTQAASFELLANDTIKTEPVDVLPITTLTTSTAASITNISATGGGNITDASGDAVIARGVVWSTTSNPTVDLSTKTMNGAGSGTFTSSITGLSPGTLYYVRAYATNSNGTDYGLQRSFTTLRAPTVAATSAASSITYYTADMSGNISSDNGIAITARGFVYAPAATTTSPTLSNSFVTVSGTTGTYTGTITGLIESTTYYVSSYATNSNGTTYGTPISFTSAIAPLGSGVSSRTASTSAYAIKVAFPNSTDGFYWIKNTNINSNVPVQIYADMTTDGGGWTLIMKNSNVSGWNSTNALLLNNTTIPYTSTADVESISTANYSIINWADHIKRNNSSAPYFQYMIDANTRRKFGGIFNANVNYSFISSSNGNTSVELATKFGTWSYDDSSIEQRMPYYSSAAGGGLITTSTSYGSNWWGTLISNSGFSPAPWIGAAGGTEGTKTDPGIIWYWVR